jgi:hypothetical protein
MIGCRNCGAQSPDDSVICQHCGLRIAPYTDEEREAYVESLQSGICESTGSENLPISVSGEIAGAVAICANCRYQGAPVTVVKGNSWMEMGLWTLIVPGLVYTIWRMKSREKVCPRCRHPHMIPLDTRAGQLLAAHCADSGQPQS